MSATVSSSAKGPPGKPAGPAKNLSALPPDLIVRVFTFLPVPDLPSVARVSRRLKILVYNDDVYEPKLRSLGVVQGAAADPPATDASASGLAAKLKQLPGGHLLPGSARYLETGTLWGTLQDEDAGSGAEVAAGEGKVEEGGAAGGEEGQTEATAGAGSPATVSSPPATSPSSPDGVQQITASVPAVKKSSLVIGTGGLKAAGKTPSAGIPSTAARAAAGSNRSTVRPTYDGKTSRELFRQIYTELFPYYADFRKRQKDSKVFKDFKDLSMIAAVLRRLRLFSRAALLSDDEDINFALETTIEWFESMVLGQFERAYDAENIKEMRRNAFAAHQLNGGAACVQLFVSKNPIFFDSTFNPSLVASKLPSAGGPSTGYVLADDFAKFTDHMLVNCRRQADIIEKVFLPSMNAMTLFVNKVFEDSIAEYLTAVLVAAHDREGLGIYLHTLATSVHCCTQFVEYISGAGAAGGGMSVEALKENIGAIFRPYASRYIKEELEYTNGRFKTELEKWANRVSFLHVGRECHD
ncbi:exocyst complex component Sec10-domain-containing protein [Blyttiomyces helicus]|uniref:Exocyst complex component Sec10-domain-containing protein n=1 Tax=Blyttiomyces helicus TaxID=388810 RepID=A0A4P9W068_9FUNG|nr:exocyst complex component Sec10-domain-containing protein [Blyttiomyces helicus]|eukprot:RKO83940.1 exocyst complex component Sec10-domain-containing protein [Blyttiomyces helicus]